MAVTVAIFTHEATKPISYVELSYVESCMVALIAIH
jgi:hypothetical protein